MCKACRRRSRAIRPAIKINPVASRIGRFRFQHRSDEKHQVFLLIPRRTVSAKHTPNVHRVFSRVVRKPSPLRTPPNRAIRKPQTKLVFDNFALFFSFPIRLRADKIRTKFFRWAIEDTISFGSSTVHRGNAVFLLFYRPPWLITFLYDSTRKLGIRSLGFAFSKLNIIQY